MEPLLKNYSDVELGQNFSSDRQKRTMLFSPLRARGPAQCICLYSPTELSGTTHAGKIIFVARIGVALPFFEQTHQIGIAEHW